MENGGKPTNGTHPVEDGKSTETSVDDESTQGLRKESDAQSVVSSATSVDMDISDDDK